MLNKLWKHEIMETGRMMGVFYVILAAATVLLSAIGALQHKFESVSMVFHIAIFFYMVTLIATVVVSFTYLCVRFYQTMYSAQGYLTHTLPVKTTSVLNVKVLASAGYLYLTVALCLLSIFIICMVQTSGEAYGMLKIAVGQTITEFAAEVHMPKAAAAVSLAAIMILAMMNAMLLFFAGSSIGQLFNRSKAAYGIAASIALYYLVQIVSMVLVVAGYFVTRGVAVQNVMKWVVVAAVIVALLLSLLYYMISRVIVTRHLNLE